MLDLLYANMREAKSPPPRRSDHKLVLLTSTYTPVFQQQPVTTSTVRRWSLKANETLQGCFEATDWDAFCERYGNDINFCVDTTIPNVTVLPSGKPWIISDLKKFAK